MDIHPVEIAFGVDSLLHSAVRENKQHAGFKTCVKKFATRIFVPFALAAALAICAFGQDSQSSQATSSISGSVVDAVTSQPLKGANVWARSFQPGQGSRHFSSASTDADGHFALSGLAPGRYMVSASREDYVGRRSANGPSARLLTVAPDQHVDDLILQLTPGAIITGHVNSAEGKPLSGASVEVVQYFYDGGLKQLHDVRPASLSGSEGEYRITGLAPGRYYLRASASPGTGNFKPDKSQSGNSKSSSNSSSKSKKGYAPAYYPGSSEITRAVELLIRPGQDLSGIDLALTAVPTVDVTGRVLNAGSSTPAAQAQVTLVDADGGSSFTRESTTDVKGSFELHDVLPGNYVLLAQFEQLTKTSTVLFGSKAVYVGKASLGKVEIAIGPGTEVSGHIHLEDKSDDKTKVDLTRISVELQPQGSSSATALMPGVNNATVNADGDFQFTDVPAGTYTLNCFSLPAGYYVKSTGPVDVLESGVTVSLGQSLPGLDLTLSSKVARLNGDVSTSDQPAAGVSVVLIPEGGHAMPGRNYRQSMSDQSGRFSMKNVVPGDYKVFAFEDLERGAPLNPDFLRPFEDRGRSVHLQEGGDMNVRLEAIPASETSP
jgi:hypothetical protein